jgi:hypothetical protein
LQRILKLFSVILYFSVELIPHVWDCLLVASRQHQQPTEPTNMKIKSATKRAVAKYGIQTCIDAYAMHEEGNGASTVSHSFSILNGNTNAGDAAINAGRDIKENGVI